MSLDLQIVASAAGYKVRAGAVAPSPDGFAFEFDPASKLMSSYLAAIEEGTNTRDEILLVGAHLWGGLIARGVHDQVAALVKESSPGAPLRISLELPEDSQAGPLGRLPWEALNDSRGNSFATSPKFTFARRVPGCTDPRQWDPLEPPLRILVAIPEGTHLKIDEELIRLERLKDELPPGSIDLVPVRGPVTPELLRDELKKGRCQVLHFMGHGENTEEQGPTLLLNLEGGSGWARVDAFQLASMLTQTGVRLAVLNCCLGAAPSSLQSLWGLAPEAIRTAGLQAVVAMRYAISDNDAIQFTREFYRVLLKTGRVDVATQAARLDLSATRSGNYVGVSRAFTTPVLYVAAGGEQFCRPVTAATAPAVAAPSRSRRTSLKLPQDLVRRFREGKVIPVVGECGPPPALRGAPGAPPTIDGFLWRLLDSQEVSADPAIRKEIVALVDAGECYVGSALARVSQYFEWEKLFDEISAYFGSAPPTSFVEQIAAWKCPGVLYLPFDGRMERALRDHGARRVLNGLLREENAAEAAAAAASDRGEPLVVNILGSLAAPDTLRLTEMDRDGLLEGIPRHICREVLDLVSGVAHRSLLFVGVSPRDPLVRGIARLVDRREKRVQGPPFFVCSGVSRADEKYWRPYRVEWIHEDPADVVAALTEACA